MQSRGFRTLLAAVALGLLACGQAEPGDIVETELESGFGGLPRSVRTASAGATAAGGTYNDPIGDPDGRCFRIRRVSDDRYLHNNGWLVNVYLIGSSNSTAWCFTRVENSSEYFIRQDSTGGKALFAHTTASQDYRTELRNLTGYATLSDIERSKWYLLQDGSGSYHLVHQATFRYLDGYSYNLGNAVTRQHQNDLTQSWVLYEE